MAAENKSKEGAKESSFFELNKLTLALQLQTMDVQSSGAEMRISYESEY